MSVAWVGAGIAAVGTIGGMVAGHKAQKAADSANDRALGLQQQQADMAREQYNDYKSTYRPLEQQMVADAQNYDTPAAYERAAAEAQGTVGSQLGLARDRLTRRPGFDPSSAAAQAANSNLELQGAAMGAQAQNAARNNVRNMAWARKVDALGLGKGLVANASAGMASAANGSMQMGLHMGNLAGQTASNAGGMIAGLGNQFLRGFGGYANGGNGTMPWNWNSGGNDGWSLPNGESIGT